MRAWSSSRLTALNAAAPLVLVGIVAGCSAPGGDAPVPVPAVDLRVVTSTADGPCDLPRLVEDGPGPACDLDQARTYELGESLGVVTPTSVERGGQGAWQVVDVTLGTQDTATLGDATRTATGQQLAYVVDGRVFAAAEVAEPLTTGTLSFSFGNATDADEAATVLGADALAAEPTP